MRVFAGQAIQADILCDGRLLLGVGRGAFAYELALMGKPIEESRERFDESLNVLLALFARENVEWEGVLSLRSAHGHAPPGGGRRAQDHGGRAGAGID